jgi:hypothetical protein
MICLGRYEGLGFLGGIQGTEMRCFLPLGWGVPERVGRHSVKSLKVSFSPSPELKKYFDLTNCILIEKRESQEEEPEEA